MEETNPGGTTDAAVLDPPSDAAPSGQSEAGVSGGERASRGAEAAQSARMNAFFRGGLDPSSEAGQDKDGASAPQGDVKPAERQRAPDGRFVAAEQQQPGRRAQAAMSAAERIADLERQLAERDPEAIRRQLAVEQEQAAESAKLDEMAKTRQADVARYRRLVDTPDAQMSSEDYAWREDFKEKIAAIPEVTALHQTLAEQRIAEAQAEIEARHRKAWDDFTGGFRAEMTAVARREGIDPETWTRPGTTWDRMTRDVADAREAKVRADLEPKLRLLEQENRQLRLTGPGGLGSYPAPPEPGRSSGGAVGFDMNRWMRGD